MRLVSRRRRLVRSRLVPFIVVAALCLGLVQLGATAQAESMGTAGLFVPVQGRLVSTLAGTGTTQAPLAANTPRTIQGTGAVGIPSSGVEALLVTFTAVNPTAAGQASVGPTGGALSGAMQYVAGEPTSNSVIVQLSSSGQFQIQTSTVSDVNIDVQGYYTSGSGTAAGGYVPVTFTRTVNTLTGIGLPQATLAGGSTSTIQVTGTAGVPAGAAAVFVDFEVQNQNTTSGSITAYAASAARPTSTLNFGVGKSSMSTVVPVDANGQIKVYLSAGNTINLIMDVEGYFTPGSITQDTGSIFTPKTAKIYDTRSTTPVAAGATVTIPVGGANGIPTVAQGLSAITANITAINTTTVSVGSYVRLYPSGQAEPQGVATTFNSGPAGQATTNLVTVQVGADNAIMLHNVSSIAVNYILDLEGWYTTSNPDPTTSEITGTGGVYRSTTGRLPAVTLAANVPQSVQIAGLAGIPSSGAGAVSLTATVLSTPTQGNLYAQTTGDLAWSQITVYGTVPGATSNTAVLAIGADGTITFQASSAVTVYLDVQGYYTTTSNGTPAPGGFSPLAGSRIVDTRNGLGAPQAKIAPGGSVTIQVAGAGGVPSGAQAVIANFTVVTSDPNYGYITPYPAGTARPALSLNYAPGTTAGGPVATGISSQVALSSDGKITVANPSTASDSIDLIVDIEGYFAAGDSSNGVFTPAAGRLYDSRIAPNTAVAAGKTITVPVGGRDNIPVIGNGLSAVVVNLTVIDNGTSGGYARAWADGTPEPVPFESINYAPNTIHSDTATVPVGLDGAIEIHNVSTSPATVVVDLEGWYSGTSSTLCPKDSDKILGAAADAGTATAGAVQGQPVVGAVVMNSLGNPVNAEVYVTDSSGSPVGDSPSVQNTLESGKQLIYHLPTDKMTVGSSYTWWVHIFQDDNCASSATSPHHTFTLGSNTTPTPHTSTTVITGSLLSAVTAPEGTADCNGAPCALISGSLAVGSDGTLQHVTGLTADLSSIPAGSTIVSASLKLTPTCFTTGCMTGTLAIAAANTDVGAATTGADLAGIDSQDPATYSESTSMSNYDVTSLVQDWYDGNNHGAILTEINTQGGTTGETFAGPRSSIAPATLSVVYVPPALPAGISDLTLTPGDGGLIAAWSAPATTGWYDTSGETNGITKYTVTVAGNTAATTTTTAGPRAVITGLTNGASYAVTVTPVNPLGNGPTSASASAIPTSVTGGATQYVADATDILNGRDELEAGSALSSQDAASAAANPDTVSAALGIDAASYEAVPMNEYTTSQSESSDTTALSSTLVTQSGITVTVFTTATENYTTVDTSTGTEVDVPGTNVDDDAIQFTASTTAPEFVATIDAGGLLEPVAPASTDTIANTDLTSTEAPDPTTLDGTDNTGAVTTVSNTTLHINTSLAMSTPQVQTASYVNRNGIVLWANRNYNGGKMGFGEDCTDFVSRALHFGGGLHEVTPANEAHADPNTKVWYFGGRNWFWQEQFSLTWSMAMWNANYLSSRRGGVWRAHWQQAQPGDVIYADLSGIRSGGSAANNSGYNYIDHAAIIDRVNGSNMYVDQHSGPHHDEPVWRQPGLRTWEGQSPNLLIWVLDTSKLK